MIIFVNLKSWITKFNPNSNIFEYLSSTHKPMFCRFKPCSIINKFVLNQSNLLKTISALVERVPEPLPWT